MLNFVLGCSSPLKVTKIIRILVQVQRTVKCLSTVFNNFMLSVILFQKISFTLSICLDANDNHTIICVALKAISIGWPL